YLNKEDSRDTKLDDLLLTQLLHSPYYAVYIQDIYGLPLSKKSESSIIKYLQDNIDLSLQLQDRALFYQLSQILNTDRKSTRLNSSHVSISYAVFCLKKKKN